MQPIGGIVVLVLCGLSAWLILAGFNHMLAGTRLVSGRIRWSPLQLIIGGLAYSTAACCLSLALHL
ncbi:hypothetical protein NOVOSPHI9U_420208 [Novosphingobium sp. 9U]|nr:hypothetical protein NOVOSPHI9U_420208 [Novosphingobium sp. 9U]